VGNASLMAFTRALGASSPDYGVRVLGVNPGPVETERLVHLSKKLAAQRFGDERRWRDRYAKMPFGRPARGDEIAATVAFLASDLSSYTSGTIVTIDGGVASRGSLP
jgi:NAD(P)-dependent dehydrogenase (short-subunit alcohol dehydrogenase family)